MSIEEKSRQVEGARARFGIVLRRSSYSVGQKSIAALQDRHFAAV
jgi:hypothetical protein